MVRKRSKTWPFSPTLESSAKKCPNLISYGFQPKRRPFRLVLDGQKLRVDVFGRNHTPPQISHPNNGHLPLAIFDQNQVRYQKVRSKIKILRKIAQNFSMTNFKISKMSDFFSDIQPKIRSNIRSKISIFFYEIAKKKFVSDFQHFLPKSGQMSDIQPYFAKNQSDVRLSDLKNCDGKNRIFEMTHLNYKLEFVNQ